MSIKPTDYPETVSERVEREWKAYDDYYSPETLRHPYFYHDAKREGRFLDSLHSRFGIRPGSRVIDIGCGNGFYCNLFRARGMNVTGVDRSQTAIDYCRRTYGNTCEWVCDDAFNLRSGSAYDYAFCFWFMYFNAFDVPQHGADAGGQLMSLLKPGGKLFLLWHSDLTAVRLPVERFSVMNFTIPQLQAFFAGRHVEGYAIDSDALTTRLLGQHSFNKYVTRLACARVCLQASSWKRARLIVVVTK